MLVLTRKFGEEIVIGDDIAITIVDVRGDKVRVGVTAPKDVPVHRREVFNRILEQQSLETGGEESAPPTGTA